MNKNLVNKVNGYIANIGVSFVKMHNLHWNVVGSQFKAVHEYLESVYDDYADILDEAAELLRMNGELPAASLKQYLELASVKEIESREIPIGDALGILLADMKLLRDQAADIRKAADAEDAFDAANMMEDHIKEFSKKIWFVESMTK
ncbi:Dps family protein [Pyramidobacter piscolens]|uniref:Dps family protein n=1 Tax=Pyramidobacter piscolens TaxID=638849 RepID=UPI001FCB79A0|nr:DNA starvation/stationary phase protection protein [Pyramidobacter piscolens]BDF77278.1 DNA starvation/stationary phase protection protein [Pyramidobacter piscolens]